MKKIKNPVTVLDHLTNRMIDDRNMKEKEQPKGESKEVKEGGELFTGGEWAVAMNSEQVWTNNENTICTVSNYLPEHKANAALIAQSKNMYYALLNLVDKGVQATGQDYQNAIDILNKATPKK